VPGSVAFELADGEVNDHASSTSNTHGYFSVTLDVTVNAGDVVVNYAALLRTARLLMRGDVFVPSAVWPDA